MDRCEAARVAFEDARVAVAFEAAGLIQAEDAAAEAGPGSHAAEWLPKARERLRAAVLVMHAADGAWQAVCQDRPLGRRR
jgi:hypothetical protein